MWWTCGSESRRQAASERVLFRREASVRGVSSSTDVVRPVADRNDNSSPLYSAFVRGRAFLFSPHRYCCRVYFKMQAKPGGLCSVVDPSNIPIARSSQATEKGIFPVSPLRQLQPITR